MSCPIERLDPSLISPPTPSWLDLHVDSSVLTGMNRVKATPSNPNVIVVHGASTHDLYVGAGAAAFAPQYHSSLSVHIDHVSSVTSYEEDLVSIWLPARLAKHLLNPTSTDVFIFSSSQRAINSLRHPGAPSPGQHLWRALWGYLLRLIVPSTTVASWPKVHIVWCPDNQGLEGNERALHLADVASDPSFPTTIPLPFSYLAAMAAVKSARSQLTSSFRSEADLTTLRGYYNPKATVKALLSLPRPLSTAIVQLRAGHSALHGHLHWCKRADSPNCELCGCPGTVEHYMLICRWYNRPRSTLAEALKKIKASLSLSTLLYNPAFFPLTATYIQQTWRFAYLRRPLRPHLPIIDSPLASP